MSYYGPVGIERWHPEAWCDDCSGPNIIWYAPSDLWNRVARRENGSDPMLCPICFVRRAEDAGVKTAWSVEPEERSGA